MAKNNVGQWDTTANNNTDVGGVNIAEGCAPSGINNAIRTMMAQIKAWLGSAASKDVQTSTTDQTSDRLLIVGAFGIGSTVAPYVSDANATVVSGFYAVISSTANTPGSGTGVLEVYRAGNLVIQRVAYNATATYSRRSTDGGSSWESWGDPALKVYTGSTQNETDFPVGHVVLVNNTSGVNRNQNGNVYLGTPGQGYASSGSTILSGTWRARGFASPSQLMQRTA